jgi:uncharacterized protein
MSPDLTLLLWVSGVFIVATLYSSVGHAGASGYIAVMSLLSMAPEVIKPTALLLNVLVSLIATWQFARAGHLSWPLFWPFALLAVPCAFLGGYWRLPTHWFQTLVGCVLLYSALRFFMQPQEKNVITPPPLPVALVCGALMGLLAGLTGTGGGIFLTPLLLLMGWAQAKPAAAVSALFILLNSVAGLLGATASAQSLHSQTGWVWVAAAVGGWLGSRWASRYFAPMVIKRLLAVVLLIAGVKLLLV